MSASYYLGDETTLFSPDSIVTEGDDPILLYTIPSTDRLLYSFNVDWDGDGEYDGSNEADYLVKWSSSRGRDRIFSPSGRGFQPYDIGRLTVTLDNHDGRFDPWNASSPLYGNLMPGRDAEFRVAYSSTDSTGRDVEYIFTGTIVDIQTSGYKDKVNIVCEDGWRYLADYHFVRMPYTTSAFGVAFELWFILQRAITFDANSLTYDDPEHDDYPWGLAFDVGSSSTDLARHWWYDGSAKGAIEMLTFGSLGRSWVKSDGQFDFADFRETTDASVLSLDEDVLSKNVYLPAPWDNLRSEIVLSGSNNFWYETETVAKTSSPVKINAGQTVNFSLRTSSTDIEIDADYCPRIKSISVTANTASDGTGSNISSDITYTVTPYVKTYEIEATNGGASNGYITAFTIAGELLDVVDAEWTYETTSAYRDSSFILDNPWLSITAVGSTSGYFEETSTTLDDRARVNTVGETLKSYLSTVKAYPVIQLQGRWEEQFMTEIEDKITLTIGTMGIDDDYRISKIKHESLGTPQDVRTTYWLYPVMTPVEST
jgi:hypothetical protein